MYSCGKTFPDGVTTILIWLCGEYIQHLVGHTIQYLLAIDGQRQYWHCDNITECGYG